MVGICTGRDKVVVAVRTLERNIATDFLEARSFELPQLSLQVHNKATGSCKNKSRFNIRVGRSLRRVLSVIMNTLPCVDVIS